MPVLKESQVVIDVQKITSSEREQILYNHVKLGDQSNAYKSTIKDWLPGVVKHVGFSPEIARRIGTSLFTKSFALSEESLLDFVNRPMEFLEGVIQTIDVESKSLLALIFMGSGAIELPLNMSEREKHAIEMIGGSSHGIREAINNLNDILVQTVTENGSYKCVFKHPTIRDAFASIVSEDINLMDIYILKVLMFRVF